MNPNSLMPIFSIIDTGSCGGTKEVYWSYPGGCWNRNVREVTQSCIFHSESKTLSVFSLKALVMGLKLVKGSA
jgi:hypothetical protein